MAVTIVPTIGTPVVTGVHQISFNVTLSGPSGGAIIVVAVQDELPGQGIPVVLAKQAATGPVPCGGGAGPFLITLTVPATGNYLIHAFIMNGPNDAGHDAIPFPIP
jgi:hypothetical protein